MKELRSLVTEFENKANSLSACIDKLVDIACSYEEKIEELESELSYANAQIEELEIKLETSKLKVETQESTEEAIDVLLDFFGSLEVQVSNIKTLLSKGQL